ncbi:MAG: Flp family type IVb pilin [Azospirillaceae bacterium]
MACIRQFLDDRRGATSIEYALIAALIAITIIGSVVALGTELNGMFSTVAGSFPESS